MSKLCTNANRFGINFEKFAQIIHLLWNNRSSLVMIASIVLFITRMDRFVREVQEKDAHKGGTA